jgi:drug/metabolite transporter (DMT)-like permease
MRRVRKPDSQLLPLLAIVFLAVIWGYNWIMMKIGVTYAPPFTFAALRSLLGALMLFAVLGALRRPIEVRALGPLALIGLLQTTGFIGFSTWALTVAGAGKTVVLVYTMPFWIVLFGWPLLGERVRGLQWPAFVIGLTGLILLLDPKTGGSIAGDVLAILAGLTWGLASIAAKRLFREHDADLVAVTAWQMLLGSIPLVLVALVVPAPPIEWTTPFIVALLYNVIPATAISWLLWMYALKRLPAGVAGMALLANPLVGVIAAWLQLGERPGSIEIAGMLLIGLALVLIAGQGLRDQQTPRARVAA